MAGGAGGGVPQMPGTRRVIEFLVILILAMYAANKVLDFVTPFIPIAMGLAFVYIVAKFAVGRARRW